MPVFKRKLHVNRGYTLVEVLLVIGISSIVISLAIHLLLTFKNVYTSNSKENRQYFYVSEALMFIENEIYNSKSVTVSNNDIRLDYSNLAIEKHIKMNPNKNIVLVYFENNSQKAVNNIITNINNFTVNKKGSVIYISITSKDFRVYEKCIAIKEDL